MRNALRLCVAVVVVVVGGGACKGDRTLDAGFFGTRIAPPGPLAKLQAGMTLAEAKAVLPDVEGELDEGRGEFVTSLGLADAEGRLDFVGGRLRWIHVESSRTREAMRTLLAGWGAPAEEDHWTDPAHGWQARLMSSGRKMVVGFEDHHPLTKEFFGREPALIGSLAPLAFGMPRVAAVRAVPRLVPADETSEAHQQVDSYSGADGVLASVSLTDHAVTGANLYFEGSHRAVIEQAWGPPVITPWLDTDQQQLHWFGPTTRVHAWAPVDPDPSKSFLLYLTPYYPIEALLGDGPGLAGLDQVLGATAEEIKAAYPDWYDDGDLELPPLDWDSYRTSVSIYYDGGKAEVLRVGIEFPDATQRDRLLARFAAKWGPPTQKRVQGELVSVYRAKAPRVTVVEERDEELELAVSR